LPVVSYKLNIPTAKRGDFLQQETVGVRNSAHTRMIATYLQDEVHAFPWCEIVVATEIDDGEAF
jgi:hypothetical protein